MLSLPALKCLLFFDSFSLLSKGYSTLSYWKMRGITHDFHILARGYLLWMIPLALVYSIVTYSVIKRTVPHNGKITKKSGLHKGKKYRKQYWVKLQSTHFSPHGIFSKKIQNNPSSKHHLKNMKNLSIRPLSLP